MQQYNVCVSDRAKNMLGAHVKFLAQKSPSAAHDTKDKIITAIRSLSSMPERCPFFNGDFVPHNKYHKMVVDNRYLLLFQIKDNVVFVDYVIDGRQDYNWLVR
ncbi:MAG: type II toxin-antitoxin system RelE/ParE family toxin [Oscillospiraceae bacterium]|nr:type II toxin-antitoxin system RelE/ParE family toxin [Oscillospiraceae bacterium]